MARKKLHAFMHTKMVASPFCWPCHAENHFNTLRKRRMLNRTPVKTTPLHVKSTNLYSCSSTARSSSSSTSSSRTAYAAAASLLPVGSEASGARASGASGAVADMVPLKPGAGDFTPGSFGEMASVTPPPMPRTHSLRSADSQDEYFDCDQTQFPDRPSFVVFTTPGKVGGAPARLPSPTHPEADTPVAALVFEESLNISTDDVIPAEVEGAGLSDALEIAGTPNGCGTEPAPEPTPARSTTPVEQVDEPVVDAVRFLVAPAPVDTAPPDIVRVASSVSSASERRATHTPSARKPGKNYIAANILACSAQRQSVYSSPARVTVKPIVAQSSHRVRPAVPPPAPPLRTPIRTKTITQTSSQFSLGDVFRVSDADTDPDEHGVDDEFVQPQPVVELELFDTVSSYRYRRQGGPLGRHVSAAATTQELLSPRRDAAVPVDTASNDDDDEEDDLIREDVQFSPGRSSFIPSSQCAPAEAPRQDEARDASPLPASPLSQPRERSASPRLVATGLCDPADVPREMLEAEFGKPVVLPSPPRPKQHTRVVYKQSDFCPGFVTNMRMLLRNSACELRNVSFVGFSRFRRRAGCPPCLVPLAQALMLLLRHDTSSPDVGDVTINPEGVCVCQSFVHCVLRSVCLVLSWCSRASTTLSLCYLWLWCLCLQVRWSCCARLT